MFYPWIDNTKQVYMYIHDQKEYYRKIQIVDKWIEDKNRKLCLNTVDKCR